MNMEEKNQYIEQYIKIISTQVNSQYGKELIDDNKISRAMDLFKDSPDDLETEIIPRINELVQQVINDYLEHQKKLEEIAKMGSPESFNPDQLDTKLKTYSQGVYLSSLMVTALALINCSSIEEINKWIDSVPNLYMISPIPNGDYSPEQIETIKKKLFEMYQDSMISTEATKEINSGDKEDALRFALHKKLSGLNLSLEDELRLGDIGISQGLPALYKEVEKICVEKFGAEKGSIISSKIVNYFITDYENFNSTTYEQMQALNGEIKSSIQRCNSAGGDFQLVISSLNYSNTVNSLGAGSFEYNFGSSKMGQELAEKLGSSYRLRSMINRNAADEMVARGFTKDDKEIVIQILRDSLAQSLQSFNSNIKNDGKNRTFELFNELVEIQKSDRIYKCVWEDRFGITLEDLIKRVVVPNMEIIKELKAKNVDFIYNETLLQESQEKRDKVMETMIELQRIAPGLITVFGDQDHTFGSDYSEENIAQLKATAEFDKKMAEMVFGKDEKGRDIKVKIECTERDLYLSQRETKKLEQSGMSRDDILKYKQLLMNIHYEIYVDVPFRRECEWTVVDNLSGDYHEHGMDSKQASYIGKYTKISSMARKDNSQRIRKDLSDFNNWKQAKNQVKQQSQVQQAITQPEQSKKEEPFAQRSQSEIEIARQIQQKNQLIKQRKNKPKVKTLTQSSSNGTNSTGYVNVVVLSLVVSFVCGALFMIVYMLLGR